MLSTFDIESRDDILFYPLTLYCPLPFKYSTSFHQVGGSIPSTFVSDDAAASHGHILFSILSASCRMKVSFLASQKVSD